MGGRRKYYRITEAGLEKYEQNRKDWDFAKEVHEQLIKES